MTSIEEFAFPKDTRLRGITFTGHAPTIKTGAFSKVNATVYTPENDPTWTLSVKQNYGGTL